MCRAPPPSCCSMGSPGMDGVAPERGRLLWLAVLSVSVCQQRSSCRRARATVKAQIDRLGVELLVIWPVSHGRGGSSWALLWLHDSLHSAGGLLLSHRCANTGRPMATFSWSISQVKRWNSFFFWELWCKVLPRVSFSASVGWMDPGLLANAGERIADCFRFLSDQIWKLPWKSIGR